MLKVKVRVRSRIRKRQNEDIVLDFVEENPVVLDVAVTKPDKVAYKGMVTILRGKRGAIRKHLNNSFEFVDVLPAPEQFP